MDSIEVHVDDTVIYRYDPRCSSVTQIIMTVWFDAGIQAWRWRCPACLAAFNPANTGTERTRAFALQAARTHAVSWHPTWRAQITTLSQTDVEFANLLVTRLRSIAGHTVPSTRAQLALNLIVAYVTY